MRREPAQKTRSIDSDGNVKTVRGEDQDDSNTIKDPHHSSEHWQIDQKERGEFALDQDTEPQDLERILYPEYWQLPTFFDIDKNDVDGMVKYWKQSGAPHPDEYKTKFRKLQNDDLKETVMQQDEYHNRKLQFIYDLNNKQAEHAWNIDYDYLYPFMYPIEAYPQELLTKESFIGNLSKFINEDVGHWQSGYRPQWDIYDIIAANGDKYRRLISKEAMYDKHEKYLRDNHDKVELIFPENDTLLFAMMNKFGEHVRQTVMRDLQDTSHTNNGGKLLRALAKIDEGSSDEPEEEDDDDDDDDDEHIINPVDEDGGLPRRRRRRLEGFGILDGAKTNNAKHKKIDINKIGDSTREQVERPRVHNFNGLTSDITYFNRNKSSIAYYHNLDLDDPMKVYMNGNMGFNDQDQQENRKYCKNGRFWRLHDHCTRRKSSVVYPNWRVLYASEPLTCDLILTKLIDPIVTCLNRYGWKCHHLIDHGYFRYVFKSEAPARYLYENPLDPDQMIPIVLKIMKPKFVDYSQDWLRHIREAIFLQQLAKWEKEFIAMYGKQFTSLGQDRAFYFVPELGHCLYPTYITVSPFYGGSLKDFIADGQTRNMTLREVTVKSLEILSGLQVMHNIEGGPYMHTDLQPRQFMIDDHNNILINDFNRGKYQEYYFKNAVEGNKNDAPPSSDIVIPCTYCMPFSHGHFRAPEELYSDPMNDKLDIWSICLSIWQLFNIGKPWESIGHNYEAIKYLEHTYQMRPALPHSMPPYLKDVMRHCWRPNMYQRPDINELMRKFTYFYKNMHRLSDGKQHLTLDQLTQSKAYKEVNFPDMKKIKQYV